MLATWTSSRLISGNETFGRIQPGNLPISKSARSSVRVESAEEIRPHVEELAPIDLAVLVDVEVFDERMHLEVFERALCLQYLEKFLRLKDTASVPIKVVEADFKFVRPGTRERWMCSQFNTSERVSE